MRPRLQCGHDIPALTDDQCVKLVGKWLLCEACGEHVRVAGDSELVRGWKKAAKANKGRYKLRRVR